MRKLAVVAFGGNALLRGGQKGTYQEQIENVENFPNVHVEIYDRFGRRVATYHGYDNNNGWNGYYNGHILPSTDYWYYIRDDIFGSMSGHFTLYYKQGQW